MFHDQEPNAEDVFAVEAKKIKRKPAPPPPPAPVRETVTRTRNLSLSITLFFFLAFCLTSMMAAGYISYQLDRAQASMAAPEKAFSPDQALYEKTILSLGYSGFLNAAQNFSTTRDRAALGDMRMNYNTAQDMLGRLGTEAPTAVRRDMDAIMTIFSSLITKAEETDALNAGITSADILAAATSLATLESRMQSALAAGKLSAQQEAQKWSTMLLTANWLALALLAGMGIALFSSLKSKKLNAPLERLLHAALTMSKGRLNDPVPEMHRKDQIGALARALDEVRLTFAQIPDLTVETDKGPMQLKFDGQTRSLFQSMIKTISSDFERAQFCAIGLAESMMNKGKDIDSFLTQMDDSVKSMEKRASQHDTTLGTLTQTIEDSAASLADTLKGSTQALRQSLEISSASFAQTQSRLVTTQDQSLSKLASMVPMMKERIQGMAEVTQLAGSQITQSLGSFVKAEKIMKEAADKGQQITKQLNESQNQMGERMFAAVNLMQASARILGESSDTVRGRFEEAIHALGGGEDQLQKIIARAEARLASTVNAEENMAALAARTESSALKMERAVTNICERHEGLSEQVITATHRMESIVASFDSAARAMNDATAQVRRDGSLINSLLLELRANNEQLLTSVNQNSQSSFRSVQHLAEKSHALMQRLEMQIEQQAGAAQVRIEELGQHSDLMAQHTTATSAAIARTLATLKGEQEKLASSRTHFGKTIEDMEGRFLTQATTTFGKTEQWAAQSYAKLTAIAEQVDGVMQRLGMLSQLTSTLGSVAGQLGQLVPALSTAPAQGGTQETAQEAARLALAAQTQDLAHALSGQWNTALAQIEDMHDQLGHMMTKQKDQLEMRLIVMDRKIRNANNAMMDVQQEPESSFADPQKKAMLDDLTAALNSLRTQADEIDQIEEDSSATPLQQKASRDG
ncbi:MAG: HAMP domain-containing protein [Alphaproteobacteria bacterium]|nr:HAMP domain-containing protein [Alphaproteobacteria bacterium]